MRTFAETIAPRRIDSQNSHQENYEIKKWNTQEAQQKSQKIQSAE
jgi:hypothetical protein